MKSLLIACLALAAAGKGGAGDWTQYRGSNHYGSSPEKIALLWPADGPRRLWKIPLSSGFSSFSTGRGKVFTLVERMVDGAKEEICAALDANDGKELWASPLGVAKYSTTVAMTARRTMRAETARTFYAGV